MTPSHSKREARRVTPEMIEAGARGRYQYQLDSAPDLDQMSWNELAPPSREGYRHQAEAVLRAALPADESLEARIESAAKRFRFQLHIEEPNLSVRLEDPHNPENVWWKIGATIDEALTAALDAAEAALSTEKGGTDGG